MPKTKKTDPKLPRRRPDSHPNKASTMTVEAVAALIECVEEGLPYKQACAIAAIPYFTFQTWKKRGREWQRRIAVGEPEPVEDTLDAWCVELVELLDAAEAHGMRHHVRVIRHATVGTWVPSRPYKDVISTPNGPEQVTRWTQPRFVAPDVKSAQWLLERRHPNEWGVQKSATLHTTTNKGADGSETVVQALDVDGLSTAQLEALARAALDPDGALREGVVE